jgi:O-antigen/teichoic acid export membrane protein
MPSFKEDSVSNATPPRSSLRANFSWMLAGNLIYAGCQWGILSLLAHLGTPAVVGQFVLALAVTAPIMSFFLLQMRSVQATDARREFEFGHYLALRLIALGLALAMVVTVSLAAGYEARLLGVIVAVALSSCADGLSDICYGLLQQHERLDRVGRSMMFRGVLALCAIGLTMLLTQKLGWAILAGAVARLLLVAGFDLPNVRRLLADRNLDWRPRCDWAALWGLAKLAAPLGLVMTLVVLNNNLPRYFVERHLDETSLGIFGAIGYLSVVGTIIVGALGESVTPRLAKAFARKDRAEFLRIYLRLVGLGAGIGAAAILVSAVAGPLVLTLLYGPDYAEHGRLLIWLMTAAAVGYMASFSGYAITAARFFRAQLPLFAVVIAANAAACHWLVPRHGLYGAAWAMAIAAAVQLIGIVTLLVWGLFFDCCAESGRLSSLETAGETA